MSKRQREIINLLGTQPEINPQVEVERRTDFLVNLLGQTGMNGFVLGISGGQDSLLAGILAQRAVERRRAAGYDAEFHAVLLPYGEQRDRADVELALQTIQPDIIRDVNIKPGVDALVSSINAAGAQLEDLDRGNVKARMRMIAHYAIARVNGLLVIGTDHAAEKVVGNYSKHVGADTLPLETLTKRQGREMLEFLAVPPVFLQKAPTADLLDEDPGRPDEDEMGVPYAAIDDYLEGKEVSNDLAEKIERRFDASAHKRSTIGL